MSGAETADEVLSCSAREKRFPDGPKDSKARFPKRGLDGGATDDDDALGGTGALAKVVLEPGGSVSSRLRTALVLIGGLGNKSELMSKGFALSFPEAAGELSVDVLCKLHQLIDICL